ncbi:MAG: phosphatase PAP2 family protein [Acetobacteraceae bacterium]|nr:phosphatase PAP2 family protein [Acetobacteraceae bacterium]
MPPVSNVVAGMPAAADPRRGALTLWHAAAVGHRAPLCAVALLCAVVLAWNTRAGVVFTGWPTFVIGTAVLVGVAVFFSSAMRRPSIAELAFTVALWNALNIGGGIMSYLAAAAAAPLVDAALVRFDEAIGFDWVAWVGFVRSHGALNAVLRAAYISLPLQLYGSILLFSVARVPGRNEEMLLLGCASVLLTCVTAVWLPALGPWVHFGLGGLVPADTAYVAHVVALRQEHAPSFALHQMQGIVTFPSFHTTLALLFTYAHRGIPWSFPPVALLNGAMLLSIPSEGGHYLADMLAGAFVALASIAAARAARRRFGPWSGAAGPENSVESAA